MERYKHSLFSSGKYHDSRPNFVVDSELFGKRVGFSSLYQVTQETAEAIIKEGSSRFYKGVVWSERLWIDVDSYEAADSTEKKLREMGYDFIAYDSGGRGGHFGILRNASPGHLLPVKDREWVKKHFKEADTSIYTHLHLFRLEGTVHERTGRRKELVCKHPGSALSLPSFKEEILSAGTPVRKGHQGSSIFDCFRVMANTVPCHNGERHSNMIRLLYALKESTVLSPEQAYFWLEEWNKMCEEPKSEEEIDKAFRSIYGS